jgi:hypothetical protein
LEMVDVIEDEVGEISVLRMSPQQAWISMARFSIALSIARSDACKGYGEPTIDCGRSNIVGDRMLSGASALNVPC